MIRRPVLGGHQVTMTSDPADQYFVRFGDDEDWADNVLRLLLRLVRPDDVVIDVGANIGLHTLALSNAAPSGRIYAFELQAEPPDISGTMSMRTTPRTSRCFNPRSAPAPALSSSTSIESLLPGASL